MPHTAAFRRSSTINIIDSTQRVSWRLFGNVNLNRSPVWFSLLSPHLCLEGGLAHPGEGSSNTRGDDGDGLSVFSFPLPEEEAVLQHRPRKPSQAWRSCEGLCAICFSHADLRSTA